MDTHDCDGGSHFDASSDTCVPDASPVDPSIDTCVPDASPVHHHDASGLGGVNDDLGLWGVDDLLSSSWSRRPNRLALVPTLAVVVIAALVWLANAILH